jgi:hypothetical protein
MFKYQCVQQENKLYVFCLMFVFIFLGEFTLFDLVELLDEQTICKQLNIKEFSAHCFGREINRNTVSPFLSICPSALLLVQICSIFFYFQIKYGGLDDGEISPLPRTRGRKINYQEIAGSESEEVRNNFLWHGCVIVS